METYFVRTAPRRRERRERISLSFINTLSFRSRTLLSPASKKFSSFIHSFINTVNPLSVSHKLYICHPMSVHTASSSEPTPYHYAHAPSPRRKIPLTSQQCRPSILHAISNLRRELPAHAWTTDNRRFRVVRLGYNVAADPLGEEQHRRHACDDDTRVHFGQRPHPTVGAVPCEMC